MTDQTFEQAKTEFLAHAKNFANSDATEIDSLIVPLMEHRDPRSITVLLSSLEDAAKDDAGMFSIIHAAESFDDETYIDELIAALPRITAKSPKWASIVVMRTLNTESTKDTLIRKLRDAGPSSKNSAKWLCEKINERSPTFLSKTVPVLLAAKS